MRIILWSSIAAIIVSLSALAGGISADAAEPNMRARPDANSIGIWKAVVPHGMKAELDNYDPIGLVAGALIKTDCAYNWRDPDDGRLYCFASPTSLVYFEAWPKTYIRRAHDALKRLIAPKPGS